MRNCIYQVFFIFTLISTSSVYAGGEPTQIIYPSSGKCGHVAESGEIIMSFGQSCDAEVYLDPYILPRNAIARFWLMYRPVASKNFRRFKQSRVIKNNPRYPYYHFRFPFRGTGQYRVAFDFNNNGYPDQQANAIWIYEKE